MRRDAIATQLPAKLTCAFFNCPGKATEPQQQQQQSNSTDVDRTNAVSAAVAPFCTDRGKGSEERGGRAGREQRRVEQNEQNITTTEGATYCPVQETRQKGKMQHCALQSTGVKCGIKRNYTQLPDERERAERTQQRENDSGRERECVRGSAGGPR